MVLKWRISLKEYLIKDFPLLNIFCHQLHPSVEIDGTWKIEKKRKRNLGSWTTCVTYCVIARDFTVKRH